MWLYQAFRCVYMLLGGVLCVGGGGAFIFPKNVYTRIYSNVSIRTFITAGEQANKPVFVVAPMKHFSHLKSLLETLIVFC